jgi:hypothetical protein
MKAMTINDENSGKGGATPVGPAPNRSPAAQRALAEAAARRAEHERAAAQSAKELSGRGGLDPVRYGDWEVKGIASDF